MENTTFTAPDISCGGCASSIKRVLSTVPGVSQVEVDVAAKTVTVSHEDTVPRNTIVERLEKAGFPVTP